MNGQDRTDAREWVERMYSYMEEDPDTLPCAPLVDHIAVGSQYLFEAQKASAEARRALAEAAEIEGNVEMALEGLRRRIAMYLGITTKTLNR